MKMIIAGKKVSNFRSMLNTSFLKECRASIYLTWCPSARMMKKILNKMTTRKKEEGEVIYHFDSKISF